MKLPSMQYETEKANKGFNFLTVVMCFFMVVGCLVNTSAQTDGRFRVYVPDGVKSELKLLGCASCEVDERLSYTIQLAMVGSINDMKSASTKLSEPDTWSLAYRESLLICHGRYATYMEAEDANTSRQRAGKGKGLIIALWNKGGGWSSAEYRVIWPHAREIRAMSKEVENTSSGNKAEEKRTSMFSDNDDDEEEEEKTETLRRGTLVKVKLDNGISSKNASSGDRISFTVTDNVQGKKYTALIKRGTDASGKVTKAKSAKSLGRAGELDFDIYETTAIDGQRIALSSSSNGGRGGGRTLASLYLAEFWHPAGLLLKGENVEVERGTTFDAYVAEDYEIKVD